MPVHSAWLPHAKICIIYAVSLACEHVHGLQCARRSATLLQELHACHKLCLRAWLRLGSQNMGSRVPLFLRLHFFAVDVTYDAAKKMRQWLARTYHK